MSTNGRVIQLGGGNQYAILTVTTSMDDIVVRTDPLNIFGFINGDVLPARYLRGSTLDIPWRTVLDAVRYMDGDEVNIGKHSFSIEYITELFSLIPESPEPSSVKLIDTSDGGDTHPNLLIHVEGGWFAISGISRDSFNLAGNILATIEKLRKLPITWDRVSGRPEDYFTVFGWIYNSDPRDFVCVSFESGYINEFATSSVKYSKDIYYILFGERNGHMQCVSFHKWEKQAREAIAQQ